MNDLNDIDNILKKNSWDLVIANTHISSSPSEKVLEAIERIGKDIACIIYTPSPTNDDVLKFTRLGAKAIIDSEQKELFQLITERELCNLRDRRALRECKIALSENEKRNRTLMDSSKEPISYIHEGMHIYANLSYIELFGYDNAEEMESIPIMDLIDSNHQQDFKKLLRSLSKGHTPDSDFEFDAVTNEDRNFNAKMSFTSAVFDGEECTQIVIRLKESNSELEKELDILRKQDLLTGLFNRQYFMDQLGEAVSRAVADKGNSVLFYIEPENFKTIKDTLGIAGSDIVLADIANLLKESLPGNVFLARFTGTIFTAIFFDTTTDDVILMADQILDAFADKLFEVEGKTVTTTCSIGIAQISETTSDAKKALTNADAASILAKEKKDKHIHIHTVADELAGMEQDKEWANRIKLSLQQDRFLLHYQPIVSLHAEPGERYEVLVRMLDSGGKIIPPNEFLETAEHAHLMAEIDRWVMKNAAKALLEKRKQGMEVRLFIKLSYDSLIDPTLLPWISKLLKAARLHGSCFVFEITESIVSNNIKVVKQFIAGLKQLNCLFNIDHLGSEAENLNYLKHLDTNYLKIDGQFVQKLTSSEESQQYIKDIADMARTRNILTIAEHVEDPACLAILWQHGVNFIQGQYLQHPGKDLDYDFTAEE